MNFNPAFPLFQNCQKFPDRLAIASQGVEQTYAQFARRVRNVAGWIRGLGRTRGCRVGILGTRSMDSHAGSLGAGWAGGAYVPISLKFPPERLLRVLQISQLDAVVADD